MDKNKRKDRVRSKLFGTGKKPRISVFRSNRHIFAQAIDDTAGHTLATISSAKVTQEKNLTKVERAGIVGKLFGEMLLKKKIKIVVFDRNGYKYHGQVKALAEAMRKAGVRM